MEKKKKRFVALGFVFQPINLYWPFIGTSGVTITSSSQIAKSSTTLIFVSLEAANNQDPNAIAITVSASTDGLVTIPITDYTNKTVITCYAVNNIRSCFQCKVIILICLVRFCCFSYRTFLTCS